MTDATNDPRTRAHVIAALHGVAEWFRDNPTELAPDHVEHRRAITHAEEIDPHMREAAVTAFAERHGIPVQRSGNIVWAELELGAAETHGTILRYVVMTNLHQPAGWA